MPADVFPLDFIPLDISVPRAAIRHGVALTEQQYKLLKNQGKKTNNPVCDWTHSSRPRQWLLLHFVRDARSRTIKSDQEFDECVVLGKDAFDPDAVFLDDIVDDNVLPGLTLAVDGLTDSGDARRGRLDLQSVDFAANEPTAACSTMPVAAYDPDQLEVYGWESSWWRKIRGYIGF